MLGVEGPPLGSVELPHGRLRGSWVALVGVWHVAPSLGVVVTNPTVAPVSTLDDMSEAEFQRAVVDFAKRSGWFVWHVPDSRMQAGGRLVGARMAAGLPDLILVHRHHGFVFAELKREKGRIRPVQAAALQVLAEAAAPAALSGVRVRVHLWRPSDMEDVVIPLLRSGKGPTTHGVPAAA